MRDPVRSNFHNSPESRAPRPQVGALAVRGFALLLVGLVACPSPGPNGANVGDRRSTTAPSRARPNDNSNDDRLLKLAKDAKWQVRRDALKALATNKHPRLIPTLVAALDDKHPQVRSTAESALGKTGKAAAPALVRYYVSARGKGKARAALLLNLLGAAALPSLRATYKRAKPPGRRALVYLVSRIPETGAVRLLMEALDDPDYRVRETAGKALLQRTDDDEITLMLGVLRRGRPQQRQHLLEIFGVLRDKRIVPALLAGFASEKTTQQRHNRLDCLLRHPRGYDRAVAALAAPDARLKGAMLRALAYEFGSLARVTHKVWVTAERSRFVAAYKKARGKVRPALQRILKSKDPARALAAARVLHFFRALRSTRVQERAYVAQLKRRLRTVNPRTHADQLVVLHARLGFIQWDSSCKKPDSLSLCMRTQRKPRGGHVHLLLRNLMPRNKKRVQQARKHFRAAWKAWAGGAAARRVPAKDPARARRVGRARHYAAWAKFMEAELALEGFLRLGRPTLKKPAGGADRLKAARAQLNAWYTTKLAAAKGLAATYRAAMSKVVAGQGKHRRGSIYWRLASLSRVGTVYLELAHQLVKIKAPRWLKAGKNRIAFEEAYLTVVDRFEKRAKKAYQACLHTAANKRYFWDLALHCEAELMTADPEGYEAWAGERRARLTRIPPPKSAPRVLTTEEIRHVVRSRRTRVNKCFSTHLPRERPSASGTLLVKFRIEVNGRVTVGSVAGLKAPRTQACVKAIYAKIRFPVGPPKPTEVTYRYHYQPGHQRLSF